MKKRRVILRAEVPGDLLDLHDYMARSSADAAERFLRNAQATLTRLAATPGIGSLKPFKGKLQGVRSWAVEGFPNHLVYYKVSDRAIIVLGVFHGARDLPTALRKRRP